jgi:hypothetical protein
MLKFFDQIEKYISYALLALMAVIVISATLEVGYIIALTAGFYLMRKAGSQKSLAG